jgi:hypothetical protein
MVPSNNSFPREGRCLLFAKYSLSPRDCGGCRTIAWCTYYDHFGSVEFAGLEMARWEQECRRRVALASRITKYTG